MPWLYPSFLSNFITCHDYIYLLFLTLSLIMLIPELWAISDLFLLTLNLKNSSSTLPLKLSEATFINGNRNGRNTFNNMAKAFREINNILNMRIFKRHITHIYSRLLFGIDTWFWKCRWLTCWSLVHFHDED